MSKHHPERKDPPDGGPSRVLIYAVRDWPWWAWWITFVIVLMVGLHLVHEGLLTIHYGPIKLGK